MNASSFSDIHDKIHIGIIVVVASTWNFDVLIGHSDVVCIDLQILWSSHDSEFDSTFVSKGFVSPFPNGTNLFDCSNTIVTDQNLGDNGMTSLLSDEVCYL